MEGPRASTTLPPLVASGVRANPLLFVAALVPVGVSALLLPADSIGVHQIGLALAGLGVVSLLLFKQYLAKLSGSVDYERVRWVDRSLVAALVVALVLVVAHTYPWATQVATEVCACD